MDVTQARQKAQDFIDALHALEQGGEEQVEGLVALFSPDARITNAALKLTGEERQGPEGARTFWTEYKRTLSQAYSEFHQVTVNEQAAGLFWTTKHRGDGSAGDTEYDGASLLVFDEAGKIRHFHGYYDTRQFNREIVGNER
jgi:hypothetical protein